MPIQFSGSGNPININGTDFGLTLVSMTPKSATGTFVDFTSIPSWVERITIMFSGVSGSGTSPFQVQLGTSSGIETTGYVSGVASIGTGSGQSNATSGFKFVDTSAAAGTISGTLYLTQLSTNVWVCSGGVSRSDIVLVSQSSGAKTLSGTLDRVRVTTINGTDTFDAGTINVMYE